ncbi:DUF3159 domain-containing protein [Actinobacteria bacterium YIM 96077]|uniref:DUF3159 domain-containing protein n=1 Tax=Phytoactinopolyspora halophila TaxID=1981511 RepID=A0A329QGH5_9ACTN|nr:DUF3159 domain-containing protein [Phytoactinopolyspora halophila]AYY13425.1 DUF3159 domain-containing protein [Actinobacteria bacterium YIM 96077]RAW10819.1 DUF3159 domain-containing protein [Phytoactinopolyspora halophila]
MSAPGRAGWFNAITSDERFRPADALTPAALLDAGLPLALFTVIYTVGGHNLTVSLWVALAAGAVLAVIRLVRRDQLQNVIAGFLVLGVGVFVSSRTGRAEDVFLPGLLINVGYGFAYLVSILIRWPIIGVLVGFITGQGTAWRRDRRMMRAYTNASLLWVAMFAVRLAVQAPLYFAGESQLGWLATARLLMSWPLFLIVVYLTYLVVRPAYHAYQAREAGDEPHELEESQELDEREQDEPSG